jgi:hypothetical protein
MGKRKGNKGKHWKPQGLHYEMPDPLTFLYIAQKRDGLDSLINAIVKHSKKEGYIKKLIRALIGARMYKDIRWENAKEPVSKMEEKGVQGLQEEVSE